MCLKHQLGTCAYGSIWDAEVVLGPQFASRALLKVSAMCLSKSVTDSLPLAIRIS